MSHEAVIATVIQIVIATVIVVISSAMWARWRALGLRPP
jgi:hypothetical protein